MFSNRTSRLKDSFTNKGVAKQLKAKAKGIRPSIIPIFVSNWAANLIDLSRCVVLEEEVDDDDEDDDFVFEWRICCCCGVWWWWCVCVCTLYRSVTGGVVSVCDLRSFSLAGHVTDADNND